MGSGMRIGELLSLNRFDMDFDRKEARVIGKGNKQRTVFFERSVGFGVIWKSTTTMRHRCLFRRTARPG